MKILAVSDIHGSYEKVLTILRSERPFDGLVMAGDLTTNGSEDEAASALDGLLSFGAPVAAVCGNMDPLRLERIFDAKGVSVNGKAVTWGTVGIFGVSGSPPTPMHTPYEIQEADIGERALDGWKQVQSLPTTIFVPHAPPQKTGIDRIASGHHVGSSAVRTFVEKKKPTLLVCGHIHEARGMDTLGPTTLVNCGPAGAGYYAVISVGTSVTVELKG
jgi:Icc-related predicted phosphoesterase